VTDTDPLGPFEAGLVRDVAETFELESSTLRTALTSHQETVRENPGVDGLVYEWRRTLPYDPLVRRTPAVYHCALHEGVWAEFEPYVEVPLAALRVVHDRQARRTGETDPYRKREAMMLVR
jgi:hypothetical protein